MRRYGAVAVIWVLLLMTAPVTVFAEPEPPVLPIPKAIIKTVELPSSQVMEIQELLPVFLKAEKVTCSMIYGQQPKLVLVGEPDAVERLTRLVEKMASRPVTRDIIYITASMEDAAANSGSAVGVNLMDIPVTANWKRTNANPSSALQNTWAVQAGKTGTAAAVLKMRESEDDNRLLIAGQIATTNGMPGTLKHVEEVPYTVVNANGSTQVQYCKAETLIQVKPTLLEYCREQPEKSLVKLDINLQISAVGDQVNMYSDVNPVINTRHLNITRVVRADSLASAVAAIAHDEDQVVERGIPVLSRLPLLKYLFSQKTTVKERSVSILKLSVRVMHQESLTEEAVKSVLSGQKVVGVP